MPTYPPHLLLVGGGHAHIEVLRQFARQPPAASVTLLSSDRFTPYSGMIPGLIAGHYQRADCFIDLLPLCQRAGARLLTGDLLSINADQQRAHSSAGDIDYTWLSLNTGSTPRQQTIAGAERFALPVKPITGLLHGIAELDQQLATQPASQLVVVGGGAASVEIILALRQRWREYPDLALTLISAGGLLDGYTSAVRQRLRTLLQQEDIGIREHCPVDAIDASQLSLSNGERVDHDRVILSTQATSPAWAEASGLGCDRRGFIEVDSTLRSRSHPQVFAVGDIASLRPAVAKSGVYAVRAGPVLAANLGAAIAGTPLQSFQPQQKFLSIIACGRRYAVANRGRFTVAGRWVWYWKRRIDRRFMRRYHC